MIKKRIISGILSLAMVIGIMPGKEAKATTLSDDELKGYLTMYSLVKSGVNINDRDTFITMSKLLNTTVRIDSVDGGIRTSSSQFDTYLNFASSTDFKNITTIHPIEESARNYTIDFSHIPADNTLYDMDAYYCITNGNSSSRNVFIGLQDGSTDSINVNTSGTSITGLYKVSLKIEDLGTGSFKTTYHFQPTTGGYTYKFESTTRSKPVSINRVDSFAQRFYKYDKTKTIDISNVIKSIRPDMLQAIAKNRYYIPNTFTGIPVDTTFPVNKDNIDSIVGFENSNESNSGIVSVSINVTPAIEITTPASINIGDLSRVENVKEGTIPISINSDANFKIQAQKFGGYNTGVTLKLNNVGVGGALSNIITSDAGKKDIELPYSLTISSSTGSGKHPIGSYYYRLGFKVSPI